MIVPRDNTRLTLTFARKDQQLLLSELTPKTRANVLFVLQHFLQHKHNSEADLVQLKRILNDSANTQTVAKILAAPSPKSLTLVGEEAVQNFKTRKAFPPSLEELNITGPVRLDLRLFSLKNLRSLTLSGLQMDANCARDMKFLENLRRLEHLKTLHITNSALTDLPVR